MRIYRIYARRHTHPRLGGEDLSEEAIRWLIPDAVLLERSRPDSLNVILELELKRDDHLKAINEIIVMMQRLGYSVVDATISADVEQTVAAMVTGGLGSGVGAHATVKNPVVTIIAAIIGAFVGHRVGSELKRGQVVCRLAPSPSGWVLRPVEGEGQAAQFSSLSAAVSMALTETFRAR